jgi:Tol biopolymer transport system component
MPIFRVSTSGEAPVALTAVAQGETGHRFPQFLPDGRRFLYFRSSSDPNRAGVYVGALDVKPEAQSTTRVLAANREAYYTASPNGGPGRLLFLRDTTLLTQPFDPNRLELTGEAVPVAEGVDSFTPQSYGMFSVSETDTGALVYRGGGGGKLAPTWFDTSGRPMESFDAGDYYANPVISPDGARIALAMGATGNRDIWIIDVARKTTTRLTFDPANDDRPVWSPDGKNIAFVTNRSGQNQLYLKPADGSGDERLLTEQQGTPTSWSKDGKFLLFNSFNTGSPTSGNDFWVLPNPGQPARDAKPFAVLATNFNELDAQFSPDGRWIAYQSNESSAADIYVRPFSPDGQAAGSAKWLVSKGGLNNSPRWSSDGKKVFFVSVTSLGMHAVDVDTSKGFQAGTPRRLFAVPPPIIGVSWTMAPDDKRFLFITTPNGGKTAPFTVMLNWAASLKK